MKPDNPINLEYLKPSVIKNNLISKAYRLIQIK